MFDSVKSDKVSQHIIDQVRNAIFEERQKPGDKLPSERELIKKFKVRNATLERLSVLTKARDSFTNFLLFKNLSLKDLSEVRLLLEPYIAEKATLAITKEELGRLDKLIRDCEHAIKNNIGFESRKDEIEFHRIIASITGNPILMFILDFVENLLIDTKEILKPGKEFSSKVLRSHKRIYNALLERNVKKVHEEMVRHIREVEKDLLAAHKERRIENQRFDRIGKGRESISIFSMRG